jgi:hypothetical protein
LRKHICQEILFKKVLTKLYKYNKACLSIY